MSNSTESSPDHEPDVVDATGSSKPPTKASRQRFKPQLSCTFCRHRKLKCDRNLPCENCLKRNQAPSCTYVHATLREKSSKIEKAGGGKDVQSQIRHLEDLVVSLMQQQQTKAKADSSPHTTLQATPESSPEHIDDASFVENAGSGGVTVTTESFGRVSIEDKKMNYVGGDHWAAILDSIACLKDRLDHSELNKPAPDLLPSLPGPELLVGSVKAASRTEILASMPSRNVVDSLVQRYFSTPDIGSSILHKPTFMREYHSFWLDPSKTPIIWIGFLYSIICMCAHFQQVGAFEFNSTSDKDALRDPQDMIDIFREKTIQCLISSNYTDPGPYTVETLLLYYVSDHFRSPDTQFGGWMVFGLIVRASMRLGLHRDASHYPNISIFKGEMQRRLWSAILHMDLQTSLQVGLPRMLKEGMYDTAQPRNLHDEDFDEHTTVLPPSRPETENTSIGYSNCKHKITEVFGMIVDQANSVHPTTYEQVMRLDAILHKEYDLIPAVLKVRDVTDLALGMPITRVRRFAIDLQFQKARCILHRKFFVIASKAEADADSPYPYPYSLKACVEAAMRILDSQAYMYSETAMGKQLYGHRWKTSSLMLHDFLLAAMLVCLYLGHTISRGERPGEGERDCAIRVKWTQEEMRRTIQGSLRVWEAMSASSSEARKAATALRAMLRKIPAPDQVMTGVRSNSTQDSSPAFASPATTQSLTTPLPTPPSTINIDPSSAQWAAGLADPSMHTMQNFSAFMNASALQNNGSNQVATNPNPNANPSININDEEVLFAPPPLNANAESLDWQLWDEQFYANRPADLDVANVNANFLQDMWSFDGAGLGMDIGAGVGVSVNMNMDMSGNTGGAGNGNTMQFEQDSGMGFGAWDV